MLLTGVLARSGGLITGATATSLAHCAGILIVTVFVILGSYLLYRITDLIIPIRVTREQEEEGCDLSQHGETAQITPIPSAGS